MGKKRVYLVAAILTLVGVAAFGYRAFVVGYPLWPDEKIEAWEIEVRASFRREAKGSAKIEIFVPKATSRWAVLEQRFIAPRYGISTQADGLNTTASLSRREASGDQVVYLRFVVQQTPSAAYTVPSAQPAIGEHDLKEPQLTAARAIVERAQARSSDRVTLTKQILQAVFAKQPADAVAILLGKRPGKRMQVVAAVDLLRLAGVPAHVVNGIELGATRRRANLTYWIEVHIDGKWTAFAADKAERGVPNNYMPWWRGRERLVQITGGANLRRNIAFQRLEESALANVLAMQRARGEDQMAFSLYNLPIRTQEVYKLLVVVPIAIFLLVLLRNVVGVVTLGTFMPVLIALAFRETGLLWGVILFSIVVGVGLLVRAGMEGLKLLLVPRLAAVLICVILIMALLSLLSHRLGLDTGLSVALFPMVILTMTIERLSVVWDERGADTALKQAGGSLVVATACYLLMRVNLIEYWFFSFPELLLILLALTLLLGRYTGYRLSEIKRFRVLAGKAA